MFIITCLWFFRW